MPLNTIRLEMARIRAAIDATQPELLVGDHREFSHMQICRIETLRARLRQFEAAERSLMRRGARAGEA